MYNCTDETFSEFLDKHTLLKRELLRANRGLMLDVSKFLQKAIIGSYLKNVYLKNRIENSLKSFKKQETFVVGCIKKEERNSQ